MKITVKKLLIGAGAVALSSALFWMITGMGLWAPVRMDDFTDFMRGFFIFFAHCLALFVGAFALAEDDE